MRNLAPFFILDQHRQGREQGVLNAYTMFIDLSGFTALTESLMREGKTGAEKLSGILNDIFSPLVEQVYRRGGFIPYFAGDAFTAIFPAGPDHPNLWGFLRTAQDVVDLFKTGRFTFEEYSIGIKIGLSYGEVEWGIVGKNNKTFYFRGPAIDQCAQSQSRATHLQVVLDKDLKDILPAGAYARRASEERYFLLESIPELSRETDQREEDPAWVDQFIPHFLPEAVLEFNEEGEFRSVVSVFCSFTGVGTHEELNRFVTSFLENIYAFGGYFKEVDFGDKGGVLVGLFGAPVTFENNVDRALDFITTLWEEVEEWQASTDLQFRIGITSGIAYTGLVGGEERAQYAAVGNRVNLAARLMTSADWDEVLADEEVQKTKHFLLEFKGNILYKGIQGPVPTYRLLGRQLEFQQAFEGAMVGREKELADLADFTLNAFSSHTGALAFIYGEAGVGKSRLSFELRQKMQKSLSAAWLTCLCDQTLRKPFNPFIYFLKNYFDQSADHEPEENLRLFEENFSLIQSQIGQSRHPQAAEIKREVERTKPVLAALVGIKQPGSFWETLDGKGRYENTVLALTALFLGESLVQPMILDLEDAHWIDDSSADFLGQFVGKMRAFPILLLVTARYTDDGAKPALLRKQRALPMLETDLNLLPADSLQAYAEGRLGGKVSPEFSELLMRTTNGNPFYLEQLLEYFRESKLLARNTAGWFVKDSNIRLSNSIQSILTARIDRLSAMVRETVKAAAVIGREFEVPVLTEVMKYQDLFDNANGNMQKLLFEQIKTAEQSQIWKAATELRYIFKHSLLREAVYDMQLRTRLRELHLAIAEAIERIYADHPDDHFADLAFHYEQAEVEAKTLEYLLKAGDHARRNFQNQQALLYYNKLIERLDEEEPYETWFRIYSKKAKVLELIGLWEECNETTRLALDIARKSGDEVLLGRAHSGLGYNLLLQGQYKTARKELEKAAVIFESIRDPLGIHKVSGHQGNLYFRQGQYDEAKSYFIRSIELSRNFPYSTFTTQIVSNLALCYMNQGIYEEAIRWLNTQLESARAYDDRQGMTTLYTNLGIVYFEQGEYDKAQSCYDQGLKLAEELGNKHATSIAVGCLGSVWEKKGNFSKALEHFEKDLELAVELGDKQGTAIAHNLLGELHSVTGDFDQARYHLSQGLQICEELGYQKGLAKSLNTLGDVYYFTGEFERSVSYYDRAIEVTRKISNKLVLGSSLSEKAIVLLAMRKLEEADKTQREALVLARELGNPDLLFEVSLLGAKLALHRGQPDESMHAMNLLFDKADSLPAQAAWYFTAFSIRKQPEDKARSLAIYRELFRHTSKFLYRERIKILESPEENFIDFP